MPLRWSSLKKVFTSSNKRGADLRPFALALFPLFVLTFPSPTSAGRIFGSVEAGFDSFTEKYSVVETDTLDRLTEFRTRLRLGYLTGNFIGSYIRFEGRANIGEESVESGGRIGMRGVRGRSRFVLDAEATHRYFRGNSVYTFANDFLRYNGRVFGEFRVRPDVSVRIADRIEIMDFERRTEFDYDFVRNHLLLSADIDAGFSTLYHASLGYANKSIPDSTEISYKALTGGLEFRTAWGNRRQILLTAAGERRTYDHKPGKSPFWSLFSNVRIQPVSFSDFALALDNELESYLYDTETAVFFDYLQTRTALVLRYFPSPFLYLGIGPTVGSFNSGFSDEDVYREYGAKVTVDINTGCRLWLSAIYEPGRRDYRLDLEDSPDVIFSDFTYHRFLIFATWRLTPRTSVNLFLNHEPEDHIIEDDDASATLFSLDVGYFF